mgnify:CR=1 FL=1
MTGTIPEVAVLLCTLNGSDFLAEQLNSIQAQRDVSVRLFVSDDGSTDGTWEMLCAAQAYDLLTEDKKMSGGKGPRVAYQVIRETIPYLEEDRQLSIDIENMVDLIRSGKPVHAVEKAVGTLDLKRIA